MNQLYFPLALRFVKKESMKHFRLFKFFLFLLKEKEYDALLVKKLLDCSKLAGNTLYSLCPVFQLLFATDRSVFSIHHLCISHVKWVPFGICPCQGQIEKLCPTKWGNMYSSGDEAESSWQRPVGFSQYDAFKVLCVYFCTTLFHQASKKSC